MAADAQRQTAGAGFMRTLWCAKRLADVRLSASHHGLTNMIITCLKCGHQDEPLLEEGDAPTRFEDGIFRCNECGAWMAYGELMPRLVVDTDGNRWITVSFDDQTFKLPAVLADLLAVNLRSVANPGAR